MSEIDWFDTLSHDGQLFVLAHAEMIRELAERGPFTDKDGLCQTCDSHVPSDDPRSHSQFCLWRRAKTLYPGSRETTP